MTEVANLRAVLEADVGGFRRAMSGANADIDATHRNLTGLDRKFHSTGGAAMGMGTSVKRGAGLAATAAVSLGVAAGVGLGIALHTGISEMKDYQTNVAATIAGLKSTHNVANVTRKDIENLAASVEKKTGKDGDAVHAAENLLLTFTKVRNEVGKGADIFNRATVAAADLEQRGFGDMASASKMLGKALNDPAHGITALSRAGVTFTASQKEQIKAMQESGNILGAQKAIMREVERQVGGSADAYGKTLPGAVDRMKRGFEALAFTVTNALGPSMTTAIDWALANFPKLQEAVGQAVQAATPYLQAFQTSVGGIFTALSQNGDAFRAGFASLTPVFQTLGVAFQQVAGIVAQVAPSVGAMFATMFQTIAKVAGAVAPVIADAVKTIGPTLGPLITAVANIGRTWYQVLGVVIPPIVKALAPIFHVAFATIAEIVKAVTAILTGDWKGALEHLVKIPYTILAGLGGIFASLIGKAASGIGQGAKALWNALTSAITNLASQALAKAGEIGSAMIQGIVNAIKSAGGAIKDALLGPLEDAYGWAKDFLGIASPSKLFAWLGDMTMQGYLDGLKKKEKDVPVAIRGAIQKGTNAAVSSANAAIATLNSAFPLLELRAQAKIDLGGMKGPEGIGNRFAAVKKGISDQIDAALGSGTGGLGAAIGRFSQNLLRAYDAETQKGVRGIQASLDAALGGIQARYKAAEAAQRGTLSGNLATIESNRKALTPAEAALQAEQTAQSEREKAAARADAAEQMRIAQMQGNASAVADAQKKIADLEYQDRIAALQKTAEAERAQRDADAATKVEQEQAAFDSWLATQQTNQETELAAQRAFYATQQTEYEAAREVARVQREDELARMAANLTARNGTVASKLKQLKAITSGPLADSIAASGAELGSAFAASLSTSEDDIRKAVTRIGNLLKAYLKLNSPADKGPLSTLDSWWTAMPKTLIGGVDTSMIGQVAASIAAPDFSSGSAGSGSPSAAPVIVNVTVSGSVTAEQDLAETIRRELIRTGQRNGGQILGGLG